MRYLKGSDDYEINRFALKEMEELVPMTLPERTAIRKWVRDGYELESNPWEYKDHMGFELNYLHAYRIENGYSSGPWDAWNGPITQELWNDDLKCFIPKNEM